MSIDLDRELVPPGWRRREVEIDTGDVGLGRRRSGQRATGHGAGIWQHGLGVNFKVGGAGELDDRTTARKRVVVGRLVSDGGAVDLRRRGIARAARTADFIGFGSQIEGVAGDGGIRIVALLQVDVQAHLDTTEADAGTLARVKSATAGGLQGHIIVRRISDLEFAVVGEGDGVRLTTTETIVVLGAAGHLSVGQTDPTVIHYRKGQVRLAATGIERLLEYVVAAVVGGHAEHVANLQA
ncbi:hypothetical protein D3C81_1261820 [compost metagenome]